MCISRILSTLVIVEDNSDFPSFPYLFDLRLLASSTLYPYVDLAAIRD
jgi:hypothetical protein